MNTNIQIFKNSQFGEVRVIEMNGENWLIAKDICNALGLTNVSQAVSSLDEDDKRTINPNIINYDIGISNVLNKHTIGMDIKTVIPEAGKGGRDLLLINESGFYTLVLRSNMPEAKSFRKWVTSEVLPAIRKHGGYIVAKTDETPEEIMAHALLVAQDTLNRQKQRVQILEGENEHLTREVKQLAPKAEYTDKVLQSTSTYTMTQVAKELGMSAVALEKKLHAMGVTFKQSGQWMLYAKYQGSGYTRPRTHYYPQSDGTTGTNTITTWTEKGRAFVHHFVNRQEKVSAYESISY
jgi:prophage antirepressor-like protein